MSSAGASVGHDILTVQGVDVRLSGRTILDQVSFKIAPGEFTGLMLIRAWQIDRGEARRSRVLVPDSAHGTNPATAARCGCTIL